ncbi:LexA family protein [Candidiatus Paracoxiella cheracis]|uniref:LexA family protein n=1 Tax=Candidiatus Paracoxiella cheracis TaxID=3405120 RepID=UPI003BF47B5D
MKTFSERLNHILDLHGFPRKGKGRQAALAEEFKLTQKGVRKWLEGEGTPKTSRIIEIANRFNVNVEWLISGKGDVSPNAKNKNLNTAHMNKNLLIRWVPILDWVCAGNGSAMNPATTDEAEFVPVPVDKCSKDSYALRIKGESMISPNFFEKSFLPGQIIIITPNREPKPGDFVVATINHYSEATFKQFILEDSHRWLKPLNPRYPIQKIEEGTEVIGIVTYQLDPNF